VADVAPICGRRHATACLRVDGAKSDSRIKESDLGRDQYVHVGCAQSSERYQRCGPGQFHLRLRRAESAGEQGGQ